MGGVSQADLWYFLRDHVTFPEQVILKLSSQVTSGMVDQQPAAASHHPTQQTFRQLQQQMENLQVCAHLFGSARVIKGSHFDLNHQDDIEAYKTQNKFLNSEIHQLTRLWRTSSEQERSLLMKVSPRGTCLTERA